MKSLAVLDDVAHRFVEVAPSKTGGASFMKINKESGLITYGGDHQELPPGHLFVVPLTGIRSGWKRWQGGKPVEERMAARGTAAWPVPDPPEPYVAYPNDGPGRQYEVELHSLEEKGWNVVLNASPTSWSRINDLAADMSLHLSNDPAAREGFRHPVIRVWTARIKGRYGPYYCFEYRRAKSAQADGMERDEPDGILDWMHDDGETLLSSRGGAVEGPRNDADDDDVEIDDLLS